MIMILTSVTMVGWADVPDSDWGDFGRRRAVDISNLTLIPAWISIYIHYTLWNEIICELVELYIQTLSVKT